MWGKSSCILCVVVVVSWAGIASLWAEPNDDAKARLDSVRQEIGTLKRNYEGDIQKIKSETDANIDVIKKALLQTDKKAALPGTYSNPSHCGSQMAIIWFLLYAVATAIHITLPVFRIHQLPV